MFGVEGLGFRMFGVQICFRTFRVLGVFAFLMFSNSISIDSNIGIGISIAIGTGNSIGPGNSIGIGNNIGIVIGVLIVRS